MDSTAVQVVAARPRKVIAASGWGGAALNNVPDDILNDPELKLAQEVLPDNYNLEIPKVKEVIYVRNENPLNTVIFTDHLEDTQRWLQEGGFAVARGTHNVRYNNQ